MIDDLLPYYEKELSHLRLLGQEFAQQYPKIASRLALEDDNCEDPHTERLIEAFAFLTARVHKKLDDEFPEIVESFLNVMYPHYLQPTPSISIAEFLPNERSTISDGYRIERHTLLNSRQIDGQICKFRTCYPVELWPITVSDAIFSELERSVFNGHDARLQACLSLTLTAAANITWNKLTIDKLRFFLDGENSIMFQLYELLFNNLARATLVYTVEGQEHELALPADAIQSAGFALDEGLLDYSERSFLGYRLLHEYFIFPEKFLFFDLTGLHLLKRLDVDTVTVKFYFADFELHERLARLAQIIGRQHFKLGCTPIINLFHQQAEPIRLTHTQHEYPVIPDVRQQSTVEVISIERVHRVRKIGGDDQVTVCHPFFEPCGEHDPAASYWTTHQRPVRTVRGSGSETMIRLVDRELELITATSDTLSIQLLCSNRDLPQTLPYGTGQTDFTLDKIPVVGSIRCLRKPTETIRPVFGKGVIWRLISHLSLNHLSLVSRGRDTLLELLTLYNYRNSSAIRKQLEGITSIESEVAVTRIGHPKPNFVRGVGISLKLDEGQYIGSGIYLFGKVLNHFFGLYCSVNSFTQLTLYSRQREKRVVKWLPRAGDQPLV